MLFLPRSSALVPSDIRCTCEDIADACQKVIDNQYDERVPTAISRQSCDVTVLADDDDTKSSEKT